MEYIPVVLKVWALVGLLTSLLWAHDECPQVKDIFDLWCALFVVLALTVLGPITWVLLINYSRK